MKGGWSTAAVEVVSEFLWNSYMEIRAGYDWKRTSNKEKLATRSHAVKLINALRENGLLPEEIETSFDPESMAGIFRFSTKWKEMK